MSNDAVKDQAPGQQSQDQAPKDPVKSEQPAMDSLRKPPEEFVTLGDEKIPLSQVAEWKKGYMRQEDYTKKTQEIAEAKRALGRTGETPPSPQVRSENQLDPDVEVAVKTLKEVGGFATKQDIEAVAAKIKAENDDERSLQKIFASNPELKRHEKAIRAIGKSDKRAYEDIIVDYKFAEKVEKSNSSDEVMGMPTPKHKQEKSIADMTDAEYTAFMASKTSGNLMQRSRNI